MVAKDLLSLIYENNFIHLNDYSNKLSKDTGELFVNGRKVDDPDKNLFELSLTKIFGDLTGYDLVKEAFPISCVDSNKDIWIPMIKYMKRSKRFKKDFSKWLNFFSKYVEL